MYSPSVFSPDKPNCCLEMTAPSLGKNQGSDLMLGCFQKQLGREGGEGRKKGGKKKGVKILQVPGYGCVPINKIFWFCC